MARRRTQSEWDSLKKRQLIKTYLQMLLNESKGNSKTSQKPMQRIQREERGQTIEGIVSAMERDVAGWSPEEKKWARTQLCFAFQPLGSKKIQ
jgi:hypothetical protein